MKESEIRPQELFNRYLELSKQDIDRFFSDRSLFREVPCPACKSEKSRQGMEKFGFRYLECLECGSLYLSPRPGVQMFDRYYAESEAVKFWGTDFFKETAEARREKMFKPRARLLAEWVTRCGNNGGVFCDIGSGYGIFLEEVRKLGIFKEVVGIEPAPNLAAICEDRGFRIIRKKAEDVAAGEVCASFVTAFEVLEHLYDPAEFLEAIRRILAPGGLCLFTTLTVSGFDIQVLWEHSKSVYPPHHVNLISIEGARRLIERCGLEVEELGTPGELDVDIVANMVKENPEIVLPRFVRQIVENPDEEVRSSFQGFLKAGRLSSHLRAIIRKPS